MLQREVVPFYKKCVSEMNSVYSLLKKSFDDSSVDELCKIRGYVSDEQRSYLEEFGVGICSIGGDVFKEYMSELNLLSKNDNFLLSDRFVIPVYGVNGDLVTLIGYYPDKRKYITIPTPYFAKECLFFNFKDAYELSWSEYGGFVILVEGIFDCLSLRSIGLPVIATMGATVSNMKCELLKLFNKVLAVPDCDKTGRKALNRYSKYGWKVPYNTTMLKFTGTYCEFDGNKLFCKDMDNFVSWYEPDDVREILLGYRDSKEEIEELIL